MTINMYHLVREFHIKHGQVVSFVFQPLDAKTELLRMRLIVEEFGELVIALHERDVPKVADAFADLLYVIYGTAVSLGEEVNVPCPYPRGLVNLTEDHDVITGNLRHVLRLIQRLFESRFEDKAIVHANLLNLISMILFFADEQNLPMEEIFVEVQRSNMSKDALDANQKGGKVLKGGWTPPNIQAVLDQHNEAYQLGH